MRVREVYKTKEEFDVYVSNGKLYEGFVIGVGYAFVHIAYRMPGNQNGFGHFTNDFPANNRHTAFCTQRIDTSPKMVEQSLRNICMAEIQSDAVDVEIQLDPETVGRNFFGTSYIGPWNPMNYGKKWDYTVPVVSRAEYPAIRHDRYYDTLKAEGLAGVLSPLTTGADWRFIIEEFSIVLDCTASHRDRGIALISAYGIAIPATFKTFLATCPAMPLAGFIWGRSIVKSYIDSGKMSTQPDLKK